MVTSPVSPGVPSKSADELSSLEKSYLALKTPGRAVRDYPLTAILQKFKEDIDKQISPKKKIAEAYEILQLSKVKNYDGVLGTIRSVLSRFRNLYNFGVFQNTKTLAEQMSKAELIKYDIVRENKPKEETVKGMDGQAKVITKLVPFEDVIDVNASYPASIRDEALRHVTIRKFDSDDQKIQALWNKVETSLPAQIRKLNMADLMDVDRFDKIVKEDEGDFHACSANKMQFALSPFKGGLFMYFDSEHTREENGKICMLTENEKPIEEGNPDQSFAIVRNLHNLSPKEYSYFLRTLKNSLEQNLPPSNLETLAVEEVEDPFLKAQLSLYKKLLLE